MAAKDSIFLLDKEGHLIEMGEVDYDSEYILQKLIDKYPNLLAGSQFDSDAPRRWIVVSREASIPSEEAGVGRWALDHLFLDQDGIPTLIEVKRSTDTRIRREVVGQILDYAANAVLYWPIEHIKSQFEARCSHQGVDSDSVLQDFLQDGIDPEQFWEMVKTNLQAEKIRLVFVADEIPSELQRIVEFLNGQMDPAEVLALQVKKYKSDDHVSLVPRVIGQTAGAQSKKASHKRKQWDERSFFEALQNEMGPDACKIARRLLEWARSKNIDVKWGQGKRYGTFYPLLSCFDGDHAIFGVFTSGNIEINFGHKPERIYQAKLNVFNKLNSIPGVNIENRAINTWKNIPISALQKKKEFVNTFLESSEELVDALLAEQ